MTQLMHRLGGFLLAVSLALFVAGCDGVTGPQSENTSSPATSSTQKATQPQVSGADFECPANPDEVVDTKDDLDEAVRGSDPGTVIAIDGTIKLSQHVTIPVDQEGLTVTCATPGSGVELAENPDWTYIQNLFSINAPNFTIHDLKIDAQKVENTEVNTAIFASDNGVDPGSGEYRENADGLTVRDNLILVGVADEEGFPIGFGVNLIGPQDASITGNTIRAEGKAGGGIFVSPNIEGLNDESVERRVDTRPDGAEIRNNTVVTQTPSTQTNLGGISLSWGKEAEIAGNTIRGPWQNGITLTTENAQIAENAISGARIGIRFTRGPVGIKKITRNATIERNRIERAGEEGFHVQRACGNLFRGNTLTQVNKAGKFMWNTGNNRYLGNPRGIIDNGRFDCDGDGTKETNDIKGSPSR